MATDAEISVIQITPVDVSMMRDPGMRALMLLAVSLGWNAIHKPNSPVTITARDGTQRRLPTNTSIRMSVFQAVLSTIMVHTDDREATPELIDAIVRETKIDRDHERRLRLAIGESVQDHRDRLANERAAERKREPDEHLTQHIEVPTEDQRTHYYGDGCQPPHEEVVSFEPPYDGNSHGALMSREPFIARYGTNAGSRTVGQYTSDSSLERVWEDGYKDYECPLCGRIFGSPKGAGSHRQFHIKSGEIKDNEQPAWERALHSGRAEYGKGAPPREKQKRRTRKQMSEEVIPALDELVFEELPAEVDRTIDVGPSVVTGPPLARSEDDDYELGEKFVDPDYEPDEVIDRIAALVAPKIMASRDIWQATAKELRDMVDRQQQEINDLIHERDKLRSDWEALRGLIDGR